MYTFIGALICLVLGYFVYGKFVDSIVKPSENAKMPCYTHADGVDFLPMPTWKVFLIQFLNIAGTGPIFGALQGILFGPAAYLWIVLGCIFGGAVHDYMSGMISVRRNGSSLPEIVGDELGKSIRTLMRVLSLVLMILVGAVFCTTPAGLLAAMTPDGGFVGSQMFWMLVIIAYYVLACLLPIDKLIGRIYPLFGITLLVMAVGVGYGIFSMPGGLPEITEAFVNHHPSPAIPIFPGICITIACGAVSGFHATQSPMMARCMKNEKYGRPIFYGAMITEGAVALIWATAAIKFADSFDLSKIAFVDGFSADLATPYGKLWAILTEGGQHGPNPAILVNTICNSWLGTIGALLAILGVVFAPVTSGDTAFRCARLITADFLKIKQNKLIKRLSISLPIFAISIFLMYVDFSILWRYFAWCNQSLSVFTLWAITVYLANKNKNFYVALVPAVFMTFVCVSYILCAPEGLGFSVEAAYILAGLVDIAIILRFFYKKHHLIKDIYGFLVRIFGDH